MHVIQKIAFVLHKLRRATLKDIIRRLVAKAATLGGRHASIRPPSEFDASYGVETDGVVPLTAARVESPNCIYGTKYIPAHPELLRSILRAFRLPSDVYVFIDLGSGKGRQLIVAAEYPFKAIVGAEFGANLHECAVANVRSFQSAHRVLCESITPVLTDVVELQFPPEPLVLFSYNSFEAPILEKVLSNIERSWRAHPRDMLFIYANPVCESVFAQFSFMDRVKSVALDESLRGHRAAIFRTRAMV